MLDLGKSRAEQKKCLHGVHLFPLISILLLIKKAVVEMKNNITLNILFGVSVEGSYLLFLSELTQNL